MTTITAAMVSELRKATDAPMMDCKNALVEANGDMEVAIDNLRKKGLSKADKKAGRVAAEGAVVTATSEDGRRAVMVEINSETDFVSRHADFIEFSRRVAELALQHKAKDVAELLALDYGNGQTLEDARKALVAKIGENIQVRRLVLVETDGVVGQYIHSGRIGVLVDVQPSKADLAKDLAMHIAASRPEVVSPEQVSADKIEKEKEIFRAQAQESGKPADIIEKMIVGRINKFLNEVSLLGQPFVKNPDTTVAQLLKSENARVASFIRFEVGEGIEKQVTDFAAEVHAQINKG